MNTQNSRLRNTAKHQRLLRRVQTQPYDIPKLLLKRGIMDKMVDDFDIWVQLDLMGSQR